MAKVTRTDKVRHVASGDAVTLSTKKGKQMTHSDNYDIVRAKHNGTADSIRELGKLFRKGR